MNRLTRWTCCLAVAVSLLPVGAVCDEAPSTAVPALKQAYLEPDFWIARLRQPDGIALDAGTLAHRNTALLHQDASMHDLGGLPATLGQAEVSQWMTVSRRPTVPLFDAQGHVVADSVLDGIVANVDPSAVPAVQPTRYALAVRRASLRRFPTALRAFSSTGDTDIDRFQESALLPGTPVVIAHESRDRRWWFVISPGYAAWVEKTAIAQGSRSQVLGYADQRRIRIVTGAAVRTTTTPEAPLVSNLQLDMGVRLPLAKLPAGASVNGQQSEASWPVVVPLRDASGSLVLQPALIARSADSAAVPLALTRGNTIRQAFKFLGERYGWGDDYGAHDCSSFVSAVFSSMGVALARNTSDQARNPVFSRLHLDDSSDAQRRSAVDALQAGDLVYLPGHVMLVIGRIGHEPYVIHDIHGGNYIDANGQLRQMALNGVAVTPLRPLRIDETRSFVDAVTDIVHMLDDGKRRPTP
ncbi:MAG: NlpC-P60 family protein [Xanthomonadaceae bacterium]|nr:NlpC-P60 family protein [Xanthomonadaceae bacterium]